MLSNKFHERLTAIASADPDMYLQNAYPLKGSNTAFRITATHAPVPMPLTRQNYFNMTATMMENSFCLIPDTLEDVGNKGTLKVISAIVEANTQVKEFKEDEVRASYKCLSANIFIDDEDSIWKVVESNGQKHLVQQIKEDFGELIAARIARARGNQIVSANFSGIVPNTHDYIAYYNVQSQSLGYGYALAGDKLQVVDRRLREPVDITTANIIAVVDGNSLSKDYNANKHFSEENNEVLADTMSRGNLLDSYLTYYKSLFGGSQYYAQLEKLIAERKRFGNMNTPISTTPGSP